MATRRIRYRICDWLDGMKSLKPASAHLVMIDPPYGGITDNEWDVAPDWEALTIQVDRILDATGTLYVFGRQPSLIIPHRALEDRFTLQAEYIWDKGAGGLWTGGKKPIHAHENIWWYRRRNGRAGDITFNLEEVGNSRPPGLKLSRGFTQAGGNQSTTFPRLYEKHTLTAPASILRFSRVSPSGKEYRGHPTQKPIALLAWLIRAATKEGDLVVDPFLGSGSTLYAAAATGRRAVGFERNAAFEPAIKGALSWVKV